ncbi:MAG: GNAT family N-acetyltransferase [Chloroflexota bacterium]
MSVIEIIPAVNRRQRRKLLTFPWRVYRDDPLWVPPLLPERLKQIDPDEGTFFQRGEAEFFTAWRDGKMVGTICAAEDPPTNEIRGKRDCIFGFFEFVEDFEVFCALVEHVRDWGRRRGLDNLLGPFHLDYEDGYGVLVAGRDRPPVLMCGHSPEYYLGFYQRFGFSPARAANLAFAIDFGESEALTRLSRLADRLRKRGRIKVRGVNFDNWDDEVDRVHHLLLEALSWAEDRIPWRRDALASMVEPFRRIADPELILFAEVDGQTVGWFPGVPNLNEVFIKVNGLRYPWNYLQLLAGMRKQTKSLAIKSVLVLPEYQKQGAAVLLFDEMVRRARAKGYTWADMSITSDDNPDTIQLSDRMGAVEYKRWQVFSLPTEGS